MRSGLFVRQSALFMLLALTGVGFSACSVCGENGCDNDQVVETLREDTILKCSDGLDNDMDGLYDCDDPNCLTKGTVENPGPGDVVCPCSMTANGLIICSENTDYACSDGKDNDGNGYIDCNDNNCKKTTVCCIPTGIENTEETCNDGIDNDCNGYADCRDNSCRNLAVCCPGGVGKEEDNESCSDGIDNDCDGYTDCSDKSCYQMDVCQLKATESEVGLCDDGKDNDLDGLIDCTDSDCTSDPYCLGIVSEPVKRPDNFNALTLALRVAYYAYEKYLCTDGIDNDKNGLTDCREYGCQLRAMESASTAENNFKFTCLYEEGPAQCSDGIDNDSDGLIDCAESACKQEDYCKGILSEPPQRYVSFDSKSDEEKSAIRQKEKELCTDGIDNDKDGLTDCQEPMCRKYASEDGFSCPVENCSNKVDDNYDGLVDCNDPQCSQDAACTGATKAEPAKRPANFASLTLTERLTLRAQEKAACTDGLDNDKNGLIDCQEYGCKLPSKEVWADDELLYIQSGTADEIAQKTALYLFNCN